MTVEEVATSAGRFGSYPPPPLTRWGITWRYLVAILVGLYIGSTGAITVVALANTNRIPWIAFVVCEILDVLGFIAAIVTIRFRRRYPLRTAWILVVLGTLSPLSSGFAVWGYVALCTRMRWREIIAPAVVWNLGGWIVGAVWLTANLGGVGGEDPPWLFGLMLAVIALVSLASTAMYTMVGFGIGSQRRDVAVARERAEQAEREQALRVAQGQSAERQRIAREMHDVVAHRISLVAMHAGALAYRTDLGAEQMRDVARGIQESATAALTELRGVLAELREDQQPTGPQPSLLELGELVQGFRAGGMRIDVAGDVTGLEDMAPAQSRHAYRIVQEALTNARKHAVGAPVMLTLTGSPDAGLDLVIRNPKTYTASVPGGGMGLVGLAERAELAGGRMWSGTEQGDFVVRAWLPWTR